MRVAVLSAEAVPYSKTGGLGVGKIRQNQDKRRISGFDAELILIQFRIIKVSEIPFTFIFENHIPDLTINNNSFRKC